MTTEFEIEPRAEIERKMTLYGPLRNRQTPETHGGRTDSPGRSGVSAPVPAAS